MHLRINARNCRHPGGFCGRTVPALAFVDPFRFITHVRAAALRITCRTQLGVVNLPLTTASSAIIAPKRLLLTKMYPLTGKEAEEQVAACFSPSNRLAFRGVSHISYRERIGSSRSCSCFLPTSKAPDGAVRGCFYPFLSYFSQPSSIQVA